MDAFLTFSGPNVRYLTGFKGSNGAVLLLPEEAILFTDPRYGIQAREESNCRVRVVRGPLLPGVLAEVKRRRVRALGFEGNRIDYASHENLKAGAGLGTGLEPVFGFVESARLTKSADEIDLIRESVTLNSRAFALAVSRIKPDMQESELAAEIDYQMRKLGASGAAFDTIVASGARSALPHARPTNNRMLPDELLLIDMGAEWEGYASDMTRMMFPGTPGRKVKRLYGAVLEAQLAALDSVREGVTAESVDRAARRVLRKEGLEKLFVHSTGHGLGLEIHESPRIGKGEKTRLRAGMVITIEPGIYLEGFGGIRIEDTVAVTPGGCEVLTQTPKDLLIM